MDKTGKEYQTRVNKYNDSKSARNRAIAKLIYWRDKMYSSNILEEASIVLINVTWQRI